MVSKYLYTKKLVVVGLLSLLIVLSFLVLVFIVAQQNSNDEKNVKSRIIRIEGEEFSVERATTDAERALGLSNRDSLDSKTGLLFVFEDEDIHGIWMKDMNFSIDVIWLDSSKGVVHIEENVSPDSYPQVFQPLVPARYILEINAGEVNQLGIEIGDDAEFDS